jgi:hypothetical protein
MMEIHTRALELSSRTYFTREEEEAGRTGLRKQGGE